MIPLLLVEGGAVRRGDAHAAASRLGVGKTDELVADDVVREAERALELVEGATRGQDLGNDVVAVLLLVDRVGELALAPPIGLAVKVTTGLGDRVGDRLHPGLGLRVFDVTVDDDHEFVRTHSCVCNLPSDPSTMCVQGAPLLGQGQYGLRHDSGIAPRIGPSGRDWAMR